jgi:arginine N-succinyltransferase
MVLDKGHHMSEILGNEFWLRDATMNDIDDIYGLGLLLKTINLPSNKKELEIIIGGSEKSFALKEQDPSKRTFLFVLVNFENRVIGTSQIFAKHGTLQFPHMYFQVGVNERYSETLGKYFRHQTLRLMQNFDGPTEIGSLVLAKEFRLHPAKLGKALSFVRFLFIAMNKDFFSHTIIAELLPPLGPNLESALWDGVGRKFTGLDYNVADMISRENKEFIKSLFPSTDIYVSLLPLEAQNVIGQVGHSSRGAAHLLRSIGFRYSHRVDPFDGGPHFEAEKEEISLIKTACHGFLAEKKSAEEKVGFIAHYDPHAHSGKRFKAIMAPFSFDKVTQALSLAPVYVKSLNQELGKPVSAVTL